MSSTPPSPTDPLRLASSGPNVSGGLVSSTIEQRTSHEDGYDGKLAVAAEPAGFDDALSQVRYAASHGAELQQESPSFSLATERLQVIAAVPGPLGGRTVRATA